MAEPPEQFPSCPRCAVLERRFAELEQQLATALARIVEFEQCMACAGRLNTKLEQQITKLERLLDQRTRDGKRKAAPFSKGEPKADPRTSAHLEPIPKLLRRDR